MTWLYWLLGGSGLITVGLGIVFVTGGLPAVFAVVRGVVTLLLELLKGIGNGLWLIGKNPTAMLAFGTGCVASIVVGMWIMAAWTKHVREAARGTVANVEAAHEREDHADKALAAAAVQASKAAAAAERKRQAEFEAALKAANTPPAAPAAVADAGVRQPEAAKPARKARRVRECEKSLFGCL
jgi:hypothetical protein